MAPALGLQCYGRESHPIRAGTRRREAVSKYSLLSPKKLQVRRPWSGGVVVHGCTGAPVYVVGKSAGKELEQQTAKLGVEEGARIVCRADECCRRILEGRVRASPEKAPSEHLKRSRDQAPGEVVCEAGLRAEWNRARRNMLRCDSGKWP